VRTFFPRENFAQNEEEKRSENKKPQKDEGSSGEREEA
jgi:hypothetical protein